MQKLFVFIPVFLLWTTILKGQKEDFNVWASVDIQTHLGKHVDMVVELSNRWKENATVRDNSLIETGLEYSRKWFETGVAYRIENKNCDENGVSVGHRFVAFVAAEAERGRFTFNLRNKFQADYMAVNSSENGHYPSNYDRTRFRLDYNIRKIPVNPFIVYEVFCKVNAVNQNIIDKNRIGTGFNYKINSRNKVGLSFYYDHEVNISAPGTDYILSAGYVLELN